MRGCGFNCGKQRGVLWFWLRRVVRATSAEQQEQGGGCAPEQEQRRPGAPRLAWENELARRGSASELARRAKGEEERTAGLIGPEILAQRLWQLQRSVPEGHAA